MDIIVQKRLQRIANVLLLNAGFTDNLGLLNGKMGIAIFFFHYSRFTKNKQYEDFAGELIDEIYSEIDTGLSVDFSNGLMGIGWGIEYLVRNGFIEADTDEVLKDIDSSVFRATLKKPLLLNDQEELFGFGLYYLMRLSGKKAEDDTLSEIIKKQMLVYLHDDCERLITIDKVFDQKVPDLTMNQLISLLWFILGVRQLDLFPVKLSKIMHAVPVYLATHSVYSNSATEVVMFKALLEKIKDGIIDNALKCVYDNAVDQINSQVDFSSEDSIIKDLIRASNFSLLYDIPETGKVINQTHFNKAFGIIDNEENWDARLSNLEKGNLGLDGGMTGLSMAILNGIHCL